MRICGEWFVCADGAVRPVVDAVAVDAAGRDCRERFLVDTGADATVFTAVLAQRFGFPVQPPAPGVGLSGVGGVQTCVVIPTTLTLYAEDGSPARFQSSFAAFTDPAAADMSILGRDVLDHFDVIVSRRNNEVLLPATDHQYRIQPPREVTLTDEQGSVQDCEVYRRARPHPPAGSG